ncbi:hypothetical protein [Roseovarius salis]|uniref:hypothetical protein n=1 Tax=Roseovarius salis TaxID=3376063 RepID=UPI0037C529FD
MKRATLIALVIVLGGCGGSPRPPSDGAVSRTAPVAYGPITRACLSSGREGRSPRLCGCIQAAANQTLSRAQQRRSVAFYKDPHLAQQIRQSDRRTDRRFWEAYARYGERAEELCG